MLSSPQWAPHSLLSGRITGRQSWHDGDGLNMGSYGELEEEKNQSELREICKMDN